MAEGALTHSPANDLAASATPDMIPRLRAGGGNEAEITAWAEKARPAWKDAGYTDEEIDTALRPAVSPASAPAPTTEPASRVPAAPSYSDGGPTPAERERVAAGLFADTPNLELRHKIMARIKQTASDNAIIEGITARSREQAEKVAVGQYIQALQEIVNDPKASYEQKGQIAKALMASARRNPALAYGETPFVLQNVMKKIAGLEQEEGMGPAFQDFVNGIANGKVTSAQQLLNATESKDGIPAGLTTKGFNELFKRFHEIHLPEQQLIASELNKSLLAAKSLAYGQGYSEDNPAIEMRPSHLQVEKYRQFESYIVKRFAALKGDLEKTEKFAQFENIEKEFNVFYPPVQRNYDFVTRGQNIDLAAVPVPADVRPEKAKVYQMLASTPAEHMDKSGKAATTERADWETAIARLRANPTAEMVTAFDKRFPGNRAKVILQELGPSTPIMPFEGRGRLAATAPIVPAAPAVTAPAAEPKFGEVSPHELTRARRHLPIGGGLERLFSPSALTPEEIREREAETK